MGTSIAELCTQALQALTELGDDMRAKKLGDDEQHFMIAGYMSFVSNTMTPEYTAKQALEFVARMRRLHGLKG